MSITLNHKIGMVCGVLFAKNPGNTRKTYFKLQGKEVVSNKVGGLKHIQSRNQAQAYNATKEEEITLEKSDLVIIADQLNAREISKLKCFLKTIQDGTCSMA